MLDLRIAIVGGGIGGLAAALALLRCGYHVQLFEQNDTFEEVGAGLTMTPNAMRVLRYLGLADLVARADIPLIGHVREGKTGHIFTEATLGPDSRETFGEPYGFLHRADLHDALVAALRADHADSLNLGHTLSVLSQDDEKVILRFADGREYDCDCVIGADGIRSTVRAAIIGNIPAKFTGNIAWRGLVPINSLPDHMRHPHSAVWAGPRRHFVQYTLRQGQLMNYVAIAEKDGWQVESWTEHSEVSEILEEFGDWHDDVVAMIKATPPELCYKWALFDRDPIEGWRKGRVTLLGDAAHPMLPTLGQGAAMALEDAVILARSFQACDDLDEALDLYEVTRKPRTSWTQLESRSASGRFHDENMTSENFSQDRAMQTQTLFSYDALDVPLGA